MFSFNFTNSCYSFGSRLTRLAHSVWNNKAFTLIVSPYLDFFSEKTGATVYFVKLDNVQVLYLDKRNVNLPICPCVTNTMADKQTLSKKLEKIRMEDVAYDKEGHESNIICIGSPICTLISLVHMQKYKYDLQQTIQEIGKVVNQWMLL